MYEWIVDSISSFFGHHTEQRCTSWPRNNNLQLPTVGTLNGQSQENLSRPAKRNYQSIHSPDGRTEHLEVKRPKRDVVVSVVRKTVAGVAGLLRLQNPFANAHSKEKTACVPNEVSLEEVGVDEISNNTFNSLISNMEVKREKPMERALLHFHQSSQPSTRKHNGTALYPGNSEKTRLRHQRQSLQLLPRPDPRGTATSDTEPPLLALPPQSHKPQLAVEEALKESDREHYKLLVEMVSEKYTNNKPLPCGRVKPFITPLPLDMHKSAIFSKTCNTSTSRPGPMKANLSASVWRDGSSARQTKDRWCDCLVGCKSSENGRVDGRTAMKEKWPVCSLTEDARVRHRDRPPNSASLHLAAQTHKPAARLPSQTAPFPPHQTQSADLDLSSDIAARLNLGDHAAVPSLFAVHPRKAAADGGVRQEFPVLTKEMLQEVSQALGQKDPNLVLSSAFKLRITQRDLATLRDSSWLNDEVINFYLNLVMSRSEQGGGRKVYAFSTFFFPKLRGGGHAAVRRWTKAVDLFLYDLILAPLHLGVHWSLAVIDLKAKSVKYYDSMGQRHDHICSLLLRYLKDEYMAKKGKGLEVSKWVVSSLKSSEIPQQNNGSDCGVFTCKYADYIARGQPLTFTQSNMPYFRNKMIWEILNQRLL
ncbi:sentrin-specific protease 2 [Conger conger]|uniref:sentrin-specific protease 2 n=1 Tax=Conger conger TaxID=82655 RepID=UPI002A5AA6FA|nr:sentrin-specific protease 2 [Conger conger]